jgi:tetratricopeptide (TPR) repeat protein
MRPFWPAAAFFIFASALLSTAARAQDTARAAWQVTRFDITVDTTGADRALVARTVLAARNVGNAAARTFTVRLNPAAEIKSATVEGATATFTQRPEESAALKLKAVVVQLPQSFAPGAAINVAIDYRLPVAENTGVKAISIEGAQFLPLSSWYPTPNMIISPRGADTAPFRLTINGASGETLVSAGKMSGATFDQPLSAQPFFLTGKWETVEGAGEARGTTALVPPGASAEARKQAEALINVAAAARAFFAAALGPAPDVPIRLVAVRRGAGFSEAGTMLVDVAALRRAKVDSVVALQIAEAMAELWIGGRTPVRGEGAGVLREGLTRYLATLFLEKQFGKDAAEAERLRERMAYATISKRDGPLAQSTPAFDTHYNAVANKGAMVWGLVDRALGRETFLGILRAQLQASAAEGLTLAALRAALVERGGAELKNILDYELDKPTDMDLMIGLPQQRGGEWVSALRNLGAIDAKVTVAATTDRGERLTAEVVIPARDFSEVRFKTASRLVRVEVDPDKLYPQVDYADDIAPRAPSADEAFAEAKRLFDRQEYAKAAESARVALAAAPYMQEARIILGRALLAQNRLDEAAAEFRRALDAPLPAPTTLAWANIGLGEIAMNRGQAAEAARRFDEAVRADAEYASTLAARAARLKAEAAAGSAPAPDESARAFISQFDTAIRSGRKAEIDALIVPGELVAFSKGIVGSQPEAWQTRVLRTELLDPNHLAADVSITARILSKDQAGTAVLILTRAGSSWKLSGVELFEVK